MKKLLKQLEAAMGWFLVRLTIVIVLAYGLGVLLELLERWSNGPEESR